MGERRTNRGRHLRPEILADEEVHALLRTCSDTLLISVSLHLEAPNKGGTQSVKRITSPT